VAGENTFSRNTKTLNFDGKQISHHFSGSTSFRTRQIFSINPTLQKYVNNFFSMIQGKSKRAIIGTYQGKSIFVEFNERFAEHFEKH
jgi:hypothetical protein